MHATLTRDKVGQYHHGQPSLLGSRLKTTLSLDSPAMRRWSTTGVIGTIDARAYAVVAQQAEQLICNQSVGSSILLGGSKSFDAQALTLCDFVI